MDHFSFLGWVFTGELERKRGIVFTLTSFVLDFIVITVLVQSLHFGVLEDCSLSRDSYCRSKQAWGCIEFQELQTYEEYQ